MSFTFVTENQLDNWVRSHSVEARSLIPTMISQLVAKSCPNASERRFPSGDSIDQPGTDGFLRDENGVPPFVPSGDSYWEIGTGPAARKATDDYRKCTKRIPKSIRQNSTIVIVNPRSSVKEWRNPGGGDAQRRWVEERKARNDWKDVVLIDGTIIADWLTEHPDIGRWLAKEIIGLPEYHIETVDLRWKLLQSYGSPNPLNPELFLGNRSNAIQRLKELFFGEKKELKLLTRFPDQVVDFVCAFVASLENDDRIQVASRALIISDSNAWSSVCEIYGEKNLILIADPSLDLGGDSAGRMIQKAIASGHSVIYDAPYGGPNVDLTYRLQDPRINDIYRSLISVGYSDHKTRAITNKCERNLNQVLRTLRNETLQPKWAEGEGSSDMVFALLIGSWNHNSLADCEIIQRLTGKDYIEWARTIRNVAGLHNPPVINRNGTWKFISRFEGWISLGRILDEDHLRKLLEAVTAAIRADIPQPGMRDTEQVQAFLEGKELNVSFELKNGLAESLAIMGSFPDIPESCTQRYIENFVSHAVREVLTGFGQAEWVALDKILPLLAEASPIDFLNIVQEALEQKNPPFVNQVSPAYGLNSMPALPYGLIWALESIAWKQDYLKNACVLLGKLSESVMESEKENQALQSLARILFPLLPQTMASSQHRTDVIEDLLKKTPTAGWSLLHELFPKLSSIITVNYRPLWREFIPDNWEPVASSQRELSSQLEMLSDLVVELACNDFEKLSDERFIELLPDLSSSAFDRVLSHLTSNDILHKTEGQRLDLWKKLAGLHQKHSGFSDAWWALNENEVLEIGKVVESIAPKDPIIIHKIVFSNDIYLLISNSDDWDVSNKEKDELRKHTMKELLDSSNQEEVIDFAEDVEDSGNYGFYLAKFADSLTDQLLLPKKLNPNATEKSIELVKNYVGHRWYLQRWNWVDGLDRSKWTPAQTGRFLSWMPFTTETWGRAIDWLGEDEIEYWARTHAHLPHDFEGNPDEAIDKLISFDRGQAALECLADLRYLEKPYNHNLACKALLATKPITRRPLENIAYNLSQIIKELQLNPDLPVDTLLEIEWKHFELFEQHFGVLPRTIESQLSTDPAYFSKVVKIFHRYKSVPPAERNYLTLSESDILDHAIFMFGRHWRSLPGTDSHGSFHPAVFNEWLDEVYRLCGSPELIEEAQDFLGESLIRAPADPDGLWIHREVAQAMNDRSAQAMRHSYFFALRNSRGIYTIEGTGVQERELAERYQIRAEQLQDAGFHRFASTLFSVSQSYASEADEAIKNDDLED